jgi:hypothetical protein
LVTLFLGLVLAAILIGVSVAVVDYLELGLLQNTVTKEITPTSYTGGRYFIGLGKSFIIFPRFLPPPPPQQPDDPKHLPNHRILDKSRRDTRRNFRVVESGPAADD